MRCALIGFSLLLAACEGSAPPNPGGSTDAATDIDAMVDATGSGSATEKVTGKVMDYFTGDPLATTAITTDALAPALAATTAADGSYELDIPTGSKLYALTTRASYLTTRSNIITVADQDVTVNLTVASAADVTRQFASANVVKTSGTIVAIDLQNDLGTPLTGLALTAITLVDANNAAVTGVAGPFFFGAAGDLDLTVVTSTAFGNRARAAFLNVPPGSYTVITTFNDGAARTYKTPIIVDAGGATITLSGGANKDLGATLAITDPSFATDIYPRLQKASKGGLGCANCHTANGLAAVLPYDDADPAMTLAKITAAGVIDTATPAMSKFVTFPLYETVGPQNHPNATFLDVNDANYKLFLLWITNGTKP